MSYQPGQYSSQEAARIAFLKNRGDDNTVKQIFVTYLKSIEDPDNHAAQRSARGAFINSLLEMSTFLGDVTKELIQSVKGESPEDVTGYLQSLRVHPNDRNPVHTLLVSSATDSDVLKEAEKILADNGIKMLVC